MIQDDPRELSEVSAYRMNGWDSFLDRDFSLSIAFRLPLGPTKSSGQSILGLFARSKTTYYYILSNSERYFLVLRTNNVNSL